MPSTNHTRLTEAGNIKASPGWLYWLLATNTDSGVRHFTLHDAITGETGEIHTFWIPGQRTTPFYFNPPIVCHTGIRIGAIEHDQTVITGGYD